MQSLLEKYPFLTEYFKSGAASKEREIAHSILFYGNDVRAQYDLAKFIAKLLNCKSGGREDCGCLDCSWIDEGTHPAVLTVSKSDNKPSDDDSKTVISIKQAQMIKQILSVSSDAHRVFIFCDKDENDAPLGLSEANFQAETANALLKTIEEPPAGTTFFFLTQDKSNLLPTIVSRSQCFFVPCLERPGYDFELISGVFDNYFEFKRTEVFDVAKQLNVLSDNHFKTLEQIQNYMISLLRSNLENKPLKMRLLKDINAAEAAKKQLLARVDGLSVFENFCLNVIN